MWTFPSHHLDEAGRADHDFRRWWHRSAERAR